MMAIRQSQTEARDDRNIMIWLAAGLAAAAALSYLMIELGILAVGGLQQAEAPSAIVYVCAASYLVGGLLILARQRWLWVTGAVANALVMLFFVMAYLERPSVMFSPGGIATKGAQLLLEVSLIYLIIISGRGSTRIGQRA
jgi:hypothetical protein